ncbi:TPA: hypothetical protein KM432_003883 [Clostridioides difficile]|uniref:hypothetical protein n=1 Tax=Clostridioides difficile TaxID=1496 RepID=UPI0009430237|nr:hypothetical protein [Clostridioides difficile]MCW0772799.1 hypothetical protein [Clostridioides difficile]HBE8719203.1 hypothetical protein [Clostridioides difficile]
MDKINDIVVKTLNSMNKNLESIPHKIMDYLTKMEVVLTDTLNEQDRLNELLKENKPSILKVSSKANISRQTIYNNLILEEYIKERLKDFNKNSTNSRNDYYISTINDLQEKLNKLQEKDTHEEILKYKVSELTKTISSMNKEILELKKKNDFLISLKNNVKSEIETHNIITFPPKTT